MGHFSRIRLNKILSLKRNGEYITKTTITVPDLENEVWGKLFEERVSRTVVNEYFISNMGRAKVKRETTNETQRTKVHHEKLLRQKPIKKRDKTLLMTYFPINGRGFHPTMNTAELVAIKFLEYYDSSMPYLRHRDGNLLNCKEDNLEWSDKYERGMTIKVSWYNSKRHTIVKNASSVKDLDIDLQWLRKILKDVDRPNKK